MVNRTCLKRRISNFSVYDRLRNVRPYEHVENDRVLSTHHLLSKTKKDAKGEMLRQLWTRPILSHFLFDIIHQNV